MKRPLKSNQRRKVLNRQHNKMSARRLSHFNQTMTVVMSSQHTQSISR